MGSNIPKESPAPVFGIKVLFFFILEWRKKVNQTIRSRISECRNLLAQSETKIPKLPIVHTNGVFTAHVCV